MCRTKRTKKDKEKRDRTDQNVQNKKQICGGQLMGNVKIKSLVSRYFASVPFWAGVCAEFIAGVICRLLPAAILTQRSSAADICLCAAAMLFTIAAVNCSAYVMCSAVFRRKHRRYPQALSLAGIAAAFVIGLTAAPYLFSSANVW